VRQVVISLCDYTGIWGGQYEDEYDVLYVDLQRDDSDIRMFKYLVGRVVRGVICQPPCDAFAGSGARWWAEKGLEPLLAGLALVDSCLRIVQCHNPDWWVLENPVGRLRHYIGPPVMYYHPCDYGDPYTKKTCLWGEFNTDLPRTPVEPTEGSKMWRLGPSPERKNLRAATPTGFAKAFRAANG